jgi:hypothetical protein
MTWKSRRYLRRRKLRVPRVPIVPAMMLRRRSMRKPTMGIIHRCMSDCESRYDSTLSASTIFFFSTLRYVLC